MKNYGEILKEQRLIRNLTLLEVEKQTGINNGNLSRWERNEVLPNIESCIKLADFYGITLDELLGVSDECSIRTAAPISDTYSSEEVEILKKYRELNAPGKKLIKQTLETLLTSSAGSGQNKNKNS